MHNGFAMVVNALLSPTMPAFEGHMRYPAKTRRKSDPLWGVIHNSLTTVFSHNIYTISISQGPQHLEKSFFPHGTPKDV